MGQKNAMKMLSTDNLIQNVSTHSLINQLIDPYDYDSM